LFFGVDTMTPDQDYLELIVDHHRHIMQLSDLSREDRVSGTIRDQTVKAEVEFVEIFEVVRGRLVPRRLGQGLEMGEICVGELATRQLDCHPLQRLANLVEVDQLVATQPAYHAPMVGTRLHDSILGQTSQRLTDRRATHPELYG
jgi:hypothetical protein